MPETMSIPLAPLPSGAAGRTPPSSLATVAQDGTGNFGALLSGLLPAGAPPPDASSPAADRTEMDKPGGDSHGAGKSGKDRVSMNVDGGGVEGVGVDGGGVDKPGVERLGVDKPGVERLAARRRVNMPGNDGTQAPLTGGAAGVLTPGPAGPTAPGQDVMDQALKDSKGADRDSKSADRDSKSADRAANGQPAALAAPDIAAAQAAVLGKTTDLGGTEGAAPLRSGGKSGKTAPSQGRGEDEAMAVEQTSSGTGLPSPPLMMTPDLTLPAAVSPRGPETPPTGMPVGGAKTATSPGGFPGGPGLDSASTPPPAPSLAGGPAAAPSLAGGPAGARREAHGVQTRADTGMEAMPSALETPVSALPSPPVPLAPPPVTGSSPPIQTHAASPALAAPPTAAEQVRPALAHVLTSGGGAHQITVRLDPIALGHVQIHVERTAEGAIHVAISAERAETLRLLSHDEAGLRQVLDQAGVPPDGRGLSFHISPPPAAADAGDRDGGLFSGGGMAGRGGGLSDGQAGDGRAGGGDSSEGGRSSARRPADPRARWARAGLDIMA